MPETFAVELPSRGVLYGGKLPGGKINLRGLGASEEALLFNQGDAVLNISKIIDNCYMEAKSLPPGELLITDRLYILFMLRIKAYGSVYNNVPFRCVSCRHQRKIVINLLEDLSDKRMAVDGDKVPTEPFEVILPHADVVVQFRLPRGKDELEIQRHSKRMLMQSSDATDPSYRYRIAIQLVAVGDRILDQSGVPADKQYAIQFASNLDMPDANAFRNAVNAVESGIDPMLYHTCESCGYINELIIPLTAEFFQPSGR